MLSRIEWMEVLGDVYRNGVADGRRTAYLELLEQIGGSERIRLGGILRRAIHEALEDTAEAMKVMTPSEEMAGGDRIGSTVMRAGDVPLQLSEDGQKDRGEEDPQDEMVQLISPPTPEESGDNQKDMGEEDPQDEMVAHRLQKSMVSLEKTWRKKS